MARDVLAPRSMRPWHFLLLSSFLFACSSGSADETSASPANGAPAPSPKPPGESPESEDRPKDPSTSLLVGVDAESFASQGYNLTQLDIVAKVDGLVAANVTRTAGSGALFPQELRLDAPKDAPEALVEIDVSARSNEAVVVTRKVKTRFVRGSAKLAYVYLEVRCNQMALLGGSGISGPTCDAATTCVGGKCVAPDLADLPDARGDWATSPPSACGAATAASLVMGQGQSAYAPLADGDVVTLERGPQCGHHVWLSFAMSDLSQFKTVTTISAEVPGGSIAVPATAVPYAWSKAPSGGCELVGVRFQVDAPGTKVEDLLGKPLDVKVEAKDERGRTATVIRHLQLAPTYTNPTGRPCN